MPGWFSPTWPPTNRYVLHNKLVMPFPGQQSLWNHCISFTPRQIEQRIANRRIGRYNRCWFTSWVICRWRKPNREFANLSRSEIQIRQIWSREMNSSPRIFSVLSYQSQVHQQPSKEPSLAWGDEAQSTEGIKFKWSADSELQRGSPLCTDSHFLQPIRVW